MTVTMSHTFSELAPGQVFVSPHFAGERFVKVDAVRYRAAGARRVPVEDRVTFRSTNLSMAVRPCGREPIGEAPVHR